MPPALTSTCRPRRAPPWRPSSARVAPTIAAGSDSRPSPTRPLARRPRAGPTTITPRALSVSRFACTAGWANIVLSIAGATASGACVASAVSVTMLSPIPCASLAMVVALAGATSSASARRPSATCNSGSASVAQRSSLTTPRTRLRNVNAGAKRAPLGVSATSTVAPTSSSRRAISKAR